MRRAEKAVRVAASLVVAAIIGVTASAQQTPKAAPSPNAPRALTALASVSHRAKSEQGPYGWSVDYSYDGAGNITRIGDQTFGYDMNGRLTVANVESQARTTLVSETYSYDVYGNQIQRVTGSATRDMAVDATTNRLSGATYDGAGNLTSIGTGIATYNYTYDGLGMLMTEVVAGGSPRTISNVYTADDERLWTYDTGTGTSTMTVRDLSGHVLRRIERASNGTLSGRDYVYRDGQMLAEYDAATLAAEHFTVDHLGTPRVITNGAGVKIGYHSYMPFGDELLPANLSAQEGEPKKFTGHERDGILVSNDTWQLDYMHARYYSAGVGRFLTVDPGRDWHAQAPQTWNRYCYGRNNPVDYQDVDGRYVVVPKSFRSIVSAAYANSPTFRRMYDAVHRDRSILQKFSLGTMRSAASDRAETTPDQRSGVPIIANGQVVRDSTGQIVVGLNLNTILIPGETAQKVGHELQHGVEYLVYGSPSKAPDVIPSAGGVETQSAKDVERQVQYELQQSHMSNQLTAGEEANLFDVPAGCGSNPQLCPKLEQKIDAGPSTASRPPL